MKGVMVLIETYWNVNLDVLTLVYAPRRGY